MKHIGVDEQGYVLVIVVGLLATLFLMALSLGAAGRTDNVQAQRLQEETNVEFLERAGLVWAEHYLQAVRQRQALWQASWQQDREAFAQRRLGTGTFDIAYQDAQGSLRYGVQDEEARLNLMTAPVALLAALPGLGASTAAALVVQRQQHPLTIPEDLMYRGLVSADVFYGQGGQAGLASQVTVWGSGKINLNTAAAPVLTAVPGFTPELVQALVHFRLGEDQQAGTGDERYLQTVADLLHVPGMSQAVVDQCAAFVTVTPTTFRVMTRVYPGQHSGRALAYRRLAILEDTDSGLAVRYWRRTE